MARAAAGDAAPVCGRPERTFATLPAPAVIALSVSALPAACRAGLPVASLVAEALAALFGMAFAIGIPVAMLTPLTVVAPAITRLPERPAITPSA